MEKITYAKGRTERDWGAQYLTFGIDKHEDGALAHSSQIAVYGDEGLRDRILAFLQAPAVDLAQEAANLTAILEYMEQTNARMFDPARVVTLISLVRDRLRTASPPPASQDRVPTIPHLASALPQEGESYEEFARRTWGSA